MYSTHGILNDVVAAGLNQWDAEPFLKKVTDIAPCVIYVFNHQTQSNEYTNRSIGEALGYDGDEIREMGAEMLPRLIHPEDLSKIVAHFATILSLRDGQVVQLEYRVRHKNGSWVWLLSQDTVFARDECGQVIRHIGAASDITAQKAAEETARAEHQIAVTTSEELRAFSYAMSHDMRSPSNTLTLLLNELLSEHGRTMDTDAIDLCTMALATVSRMGCLVDDVQRYTQVINRELKIRPTDLNRLLASVTKELEGIIRLHAAEVTIGQLPTVSADAEQLRILFHNLIENALTFHKHGASPRVHIDASKKPGSRQHRISVRDEGIGIDPDKHAQIFHVFKRLNEKPGVSGTGLGLAICKRIAVNHGGQINLHSVKGEGATFEIVLPSV